MSVLGRPGILSFPQAESPADQDYSGRYELLLDTAAQWARGLGAGLSTARQWIESEAIEKRPLTTLGIAFGLGVLSGWLVKRR